MATLNLFKTTKSIYDPVLIGKILKDYNNYESCVSISKKYNLSRDQLYRFYEVNNIKPKLLPHRTAEGQEEIIEMYVVERMSTPEIGKKFGCGYGAILKVLNENNIPIRSMSDAKREYPIDEHFFDVIDTEQKAYILGMLYADGYNNEATRKVKLSLHTKDEKIVGQIRDIISPSRPLYYYTKDRINKKGEKITLQSVTTIFCNKHMSETLAKLGCMQNKSFKITFPEFLDEKLVHHFIRGYFDGDGCITFTSEPTGINPDHKKYGISFVGTESFIMSLKGILHDKFNTGGYVGNRFPERNNNTRSLCFSGNRQCRRIMEWLYNDATIYMERKHNRYLNLCKQCDEIDERQEK